MSRLTTEERLRIADAVRSVEQHTRAEIVPMVVSKSGLYRDAQHHAGLILAFLTLTCLLTLDVTWLPWSWHAANAAWLVLATVAAYASGVWMGTFPTVIRFVTSTERMKQKVRLRAERAFAQHEIARTAERTGVLLMLSMLERQVLILPDREIARLVPSDRWNEVVQAIVERLKSGDIAGSLCAGIDRCQTILAQACPPASGGNPNEISDRLIEEP
ncbi:MAG TPA: TPM domain-containing protein [Nitrospira sp.]